jgi:thiamine biosynthesis lipoprotein
LLDPRTGWPVKGMMSVSIVAEQAVVAGSLASIAMLKDKEDAISWLESLEVPFLAVDQDCNCYGEKVA